MAKAEKIDHSGGAVMSEDKRDELEEKVFLVGLKENAPMHYFNVPTKGDLKSVNVTKKTKSLTPHPTREGMQVLSPTRNITGRLEALCEDEFNAFLKFVREYAFKVSMQSAEKKDPDTGLTRTVKVAKCNGVVPIVQPKDAGVTRMRRAQGANLWPLAEYVYIVPKKDASHYEDTPPTVAEVEASGKKLVF